MWWKYFVMLILTDGVLLPLQMIKSLKYATRVIRGDAQTKNNCYETKFVLNNISVKSLLPDV